MADEGVGADVEAFRAVYVAHARAVYGFFRNRVSHHDAEDLTSETFVRAYRAFGRYDDRGLPIRAWLMRIARNLFIERGRKRAAQVVAPDQLDRPVDDHQDAVTTRVEGVVALAALASLPEGQATVIDLRLLRGLSVAEVAAVLESTEEAVRALTYRALRALRAAHAKAWGTADE